MLIECSKCESKVDAKILTEREYGSTDDCDPFIYYFLECPACLGVMVGHSDLVQYGPDKWDFEHPTRVWPDPVHSGFLHPSIPKIVQDSIEEGRRCFKARAYLACAVMCGRAIEAICKEEKTASHSLAEGLKELKNKGVIDGRLFEWSEALRKHRNIGAHASEEVISREDAQDILEFAIAICEYIYVLSDRYAKFQARLGKLKESHNR